MDFMPVYGYFCTMIGKDINEAARLLQAGELVAIPTETVYGLAGNALDVNAVAQIFSVKQRPSFNPLILHFAELKDIDDYVVAFPEKLKVLSEKLMPGPLTLLLKKKDIVPDLVTAGSDRVAVRLPAHPMTHQLLSLLDFPVAAPSANPFGYVSPTTASHVDRQLGSKIPYILDGGPCWVGIESTIVGEEGGDIVVYRKGGTTLEDIEAIIGAVKSFTHSDSNPLAPGMLSGHYAPTKPLYVGDISAMLQQFVGKRCAVIAFSQCFEGVAAENMMVLSPTANYGEAARKLFQYLRMTEDLDVDLVLAEFLPEIDLGRAINDRLRRAAHRQTGTY